MMQKEIPTGEIKSFGEHGIIYQVGEKEKDLPDGDVLVNIILLESGEKAQYKLSEIINDPKAK